LLRLLVVVGVSVIGSHIYLVKSPTQHNLLQPKEKTINNSDRLHSINTRPTHDQHSINTRSIKTLRNWKTSCSQKYL